MKTAINICRALLTLSISYKITAYHITPRTRTKIISPRPFSLHLDTNGLIRNKKIAQYSKCTAMKKDFDGMEQISEYNNAINFDTCDRREALSFSFNYLKSASIYSTLITSSLAFNPSNTEAATPANPVNIDVELTTEDGLLESRVTENLLSPPTYGLEDPDIYYPDYFAGVWNVTSVGTEVKAPCGIALFGGNSTYQAALREIGQENALRYRARFLPDEIPSSQKKISIADREFNVREIAKAAMGKNSVLDVSLVTPNKFSCILAPLGADKTFSVDMISLARRQENRSKNKFDASEVVRQIISPANNKTPNGIPSANPQSAPNLKEIETISLYSVDSDMGKVTTIKCMQRSATFLLPSQTDPMAYKMWQATRGRPIDVRFYEVTYTKNQ